MTDRKKGSRPGFRLVRGGGLRIAGVEIVVAPEERSPFPVGAVVVEDDTYSVLGAGPSISMKIEHPIRTWTGLLDAVEAVPGSVIVKPGPPPRFLAVVHDLARDPTWTEPWVATAVETAIREAEDRAIESLSMPPIGGVHGKLSPRRFVELLRSALRACRPDHLRRIWIVAPDERAGELLLAVSEVSDRTRSEGVE